MNQISRVLGLAKDPKQTKWLAPLLLVADAVLCAAIIYKIPYTEIDWKAYMEQVAIYTKGEKNYANISGGTGPLVYPGLHVHIYRLLYVATDHGENILAAQSIFAVLYLATLAVVMACYRQAEAPPYVFPLLILSKRLHSIFVLRMFNDCFTVLFLFLAIYFYQRKSWTLGSAFFTCGLGVKMNLLLVLPALGFIFLQGIGIDRSVTQGLLISQAQGLFAYEFVSVNWKSYVGRAFQFNRQFLYKWTVNWRFVPKHIFLSSTFSRALLGAHAGLLLLFATTRWTKPSQRSLQDTLRLYFRGRNWEAIEMIAERITPEFVLTTILTANTIGMLCARSLHYQFYSWTAWATPFLLWRAGFHPIIMYAVWAGQEWAWNVYPSTDASSAVVVGSLAATLAGVWWGTRKGPGGLEDSVEPLEDADKKKK